MSEKIFVLLTPNDVDLIRCVIARWLKAGVWSDPTEPDLITWQLMASEMRRIHEEIRIGPPDERSHHVALSKT